MSEPEEPDSHIEPRRILDGDELWDIFQRMGLQVGLDAGAYPRSAVLLMPTIQADGSLVMEYTSSESMTWLEEYGAHTAWGKIIDINHDWMRRSDDQD